MKPASTSQAMFSCAFLLYRPVLSSCTSSNPDLYPHVQTCFQRAHLSLVKTFPFRAVVVYKALGPLSLANVLLHPESPHGHGPRIGSRGLGIAKIQLTRVLVQVLHL